MTEEPNVGIALEVSKGFGRVAAVRDVNISIAEGEFFSLLGPSGCGKTTSLPLSRLATARLDLESGRSSHYRKESKWPSSRFRRATTA